MARICLKTSRVQTLCLIVFLLPLPLFYLLHVHISQESHYTKHALDHRHRELVKTNVYNSNYSASIRRVLVRETRRLSTGNIRSVFEKKKCRSRICREFLSDKDMGYFGYCWKKSRLRRESPRSVCQFMNASSRPPIALASFPGSGNTWIRGLLQRATGVCTGGIYCDTTLRNSGYPGESLRSGNTLVVKTHQVDPRWTGIYYPPNTTDRYFTKESDIPIYDAAIVLVRNPFHALVAEWNRQMTVNMSLGGHDSHTNAVDAKYFCEFCSTASSSKSQSFTFETRVVWLRNSGTVDSTHHVSTYILWSVFLVMRFTRLCVYVEVLMSVNSV